MDATAPARPTFGSLAASDGANSFDLCRLLLATAVIYSHAYVLTGSDTEPVIRWTRQQANAGGLAVFGFFVISGFLITGSWLRTASASQYLGRRVRRIVPGFTVAVLFSFLVAGPLGSASVRAYFADPTAYRFLELLAFKGPQEVATTFQRCPVPGNLNGSLWTIRIEFACYLLVAAAGRLRLWRSVPAAVVATLAVAVVGRVAATHPPRPLGLFALGLAMYAPAFAIGSVCFLLRDRIPHSFPLFLAAVAALAAAARLGGFPNVLLACGGYAVLYLGLLPATPWTDVGRYGDFSYGLYLYAFPVQQLVVSFTGSGPTANFCLSSAVAMGLAIPSWRYVERPFLRRRRQPRVGPAATRPDRGPADAGTVPPAGR